MTTQPLTQSVSWRTTRASLAYLGAGSLWLARAVFPTGMLAQRATRGSSPEEDLLRETERRRLRALVDVDMDVAAPLHADDFQLITPVGTSLSKDEYLGGLASGALDYVVFEPLTEIATKMYDGVAVIRYQSRIEIVVDGQAVPSGVVWHTDVYEKRDGQWQVVWAQATAIQ